VIVSALAIVITGLVYVALATFVWHRPWPHQIIGAFCSAYVNANNIGVPIMAFVLKDTSWIAPILLLQVVILQPIGLALLDIDYARRHGRRASLGRSLSTPVRNPLTIAVVLGLVFSLFGWSLPNVIDQPISTLGGLGVPAMLIGFGISLAFAKLPKRGPDLDETVFLILAKLLIQPLIAIGLALFVFHLDMTATEAVAIAAGLPVAQNVFVFATRYQTTTDLARDCVFVTTVMSTLTLTLIIGVLRMVLGVH
jgi:predicted permease